MKTTIFRNFPPLSFTCCTKSGSAESQSVIGQHDAFLQQSSTKTTVLNNFWLFQRHSSLKFTETRACNNTRPFSAYNTHVLNIAIQDFLIVKWAVDFIIGTRKTAEIRPLPQTDQDRIPRRPQRTSKLLTFLNFTASYSPIATKTIFDQIFHSWKSRQFEVL